MNAHTNTGFTLIEVMIVVAISAALASTIIIWQGTFSENARFLDAMDSLHSQLNESRREVYAVVSRKSSDDDPGTETDRVMYGYAVEFRADGNQATIHTLTATTSGDVFEDQSVSDISIQNDLERTLDIKWGTTFAEGERGGSDSVNTIAFVRDFGSEELKTYTLPNNRITDVELYEASAEQRAKARRPAQFRFETPEGNTATIHVNETANSLRRSFD